MEIHRILAAKIYLFLQGFRAKYFLKNAPQKYSRWEIPSLTCKSELLPSFQRSVISDEMIGVPIEPWARIVIEVIGSMSVFVEGNVICGSEEGEGVGPELPFSVFRQWSYYHIMKGGWELIAECLIAVWYDCGKSQVWSRKMSKVNIRFPQID